MSSKPFWQKQEWNKGIKGYHSPSIIKVEGMYPYLLELAEFYNDKDILDLGCGPGHIAQLISENFKARSYTAVDYSQIFIDYANSLSVSSSIKPDFLIGDVRDLDLGDKRFDTVLCLNVLPIFNSEEDFDKLLHTIKSRLKPSSKLIFMTTYDACILSPQVNENFQVTLIDAKSEPIKYHLKVKNVEGEFFEFSDNCWTTKIVESKLAAVGLRVTKVTKIGGSESFPDCYPFISFVAEN